MTTKYRAWQPPEPTFEIGLEPIPGFPRRLSAKQGKAIHDAYAELDKAICNYFDALSPAIKARNDHQRKVKDLLVFTCYNIIGGI